MKTIILLLLFLFSPLISLADNSCLSGVRLTGSYFVDKGKGYQPSTLTIRSTKNNISIFPFELEAYWSSWPNDDGSRTTQAIYAGEMKVNGCTGTYYSEEDDCRFSFKLSLNSITVSHTGECMSIGHNANPSGIYLKR
jgi:hypothetical protein